MPAAGLDTTRALRNLALVAEAKERGVSWRAIGAATGTDGKTAKVRAKKLARQTRRALARQAVNAES